MSHHRAWFLAAHGSQRSYWTGAFIILLVAVLAGCGGGGPNVKVDDFAPSGEVERATNFTVIFSRDVVSDSLMNRPVEGTPVVFSPEVPGRFQWIAPDRLRFYPDVKLAPSTQYTVEVQPSAVRPYGYALRGERTFTVQTPRLALRSAYLTFEYDAATNTQAALQATIEFNEPVAPEDVREYVSIRYEDGERVPYEVTMEGPSEVVTLEAPAVQRGEDERQIELRVEQGLTGVGGNLGLADTYTQPATLPGQNDLQVEQLAAVRESASSQYLKVQFNLPVPAENVGSYVSITPAVEVEPVSTHDYLRLRGDFAADQTYRVTLREGLRAIDGTTLPRDYTTAVTFRQEDIPPQVDFVGDGFYLSRKGHLNLGLSTINLDKVTVEIDKIFANNLVHVLNAYNLASADGYYYWIADVEQLGRRVYEDDLVVPIEPNQEVVTPINVAEYLGGQRTGIFKVTARQTDQRWEQSARWVVATDLGLMVKEAGDDLWVWVNSISTLRSLDGVEVTLYSQNNQSLATVWTSEDGVAVFKDYAQYEDEFTPYVVTASLGSDLSFVELTRRRIETSDFDVGGMPYLQNGYEAFVYNERGVYRPGETAHLATVVRGPNSRVPQPFPVRLRVTGPDGKILSEQRARLNEQGGAGFSVEVPDYVLTGRYTAALLVGENQEIGRTSFSIEEFVPDRMKVSLDTDDDVYRPGEVMTIDVEGQTLFGPPAAGRRVQAEVEVEAYPFSPDDFRSFTFGDPSRTYSSVEAELEETTLNDDGRATLRYTIPNNLRPPASLRAIVEATVLEPGGRGVTAYAGAVVHPYATYVGVKARQEGYAEPNTAFPISFVVTDTDGAPVAGRTVQVDLYRDYWNTIWRRGNDGRFRYVSEKTEVLEAQATATSTDGVAQFSVTPRDYGSYRVVVTDPQSGAASVLSFYSSGWGYAAWAMDSPDRVELELDKATYQPGDRAEVLVRAPFPGKLLLTVEREQVFDHFVVSMEENTATVEVPVSETYKPNVYVSVHLIRSTEGLERDESARAFGVVPLTVNTEPNRLAVSLDAPAEMRPQNELTVDFRVQGGNGVPFVTIAAVDEGITQLTDFQTPDPHGFFYGKKRLDVDTYDVYGLILPEVSASLSSPAGDVEAARRRRVNPAAARRVKPVAFWSGVVETDGRGRGSVTFDVPQFNGTIRLMAVAYAGDDYGHAEQPVLVRDPIVMTPTFPRFLGSGDEAVVPVSVFNGTGRDAEFEVHLAADGPVQLQEGGTKTVRVADGREGQVQFRVAADRALGKATFRLTARGGGEATEDEVEVPVRPPVPFTTEGGSGSLEAGETARFTFPDTFLPGTGRYELIVSSFPAVRFAGSLHYLLQYPHGCLEQTTSRVFPLLAFNDVARVVAPRLFEVNSADYYVEEGIQKLERMQMPSGAFAYWPGGTYSNDWSTIYASHFLIEARKAGYVVTEHVYDRMLNALSAISRDYRRSDHATLARSAYAVYVLALAGQPERSTQLYLKNNALDDLPTYARYHLAGAFALSGDRRAARDLLPQEARPPTTIQTRDTGGNFSSAIRSQALMLDILAEVDPGSPQVPYLVEELTRKAEVGRWYTTQENAFAFLALGKILRQQATSDYTGTFAIAGGPSVSFDETSQRFDSEDWAGQEATLTLQGSGTAYYYWRADGLPSSLEMPAYDRDLTVRRRYLNERGEPLASLTNLQQGDVVIAQLTIQSRGETIENVAVIDLLPAGLEIENPRLQSRAGIDWIGDDENAYLPDYLDIRDDRLVLYGDARADKPRTFYYGLRVVTAGSFRLPPVRAEAMYAPTKASVSSAGRVVVRSLGNASP